MNPDLGVYTMVPFALTLAVPSSGVVTADTVAEWGRSFESGLNVTDLPAVVLAVTAARPEIAIGSVTEGSRNTLSSLKKSIACTPNKNAVPSSELWLEGRRGKELFLPACQAN